jgi:hypothetical protein
MPAPATVNRSVSGHREEADRHDRQRDRRPVRAMHEPTQAEQEKRESDDGRPDRITEEEDDMITEGPSHRTEKRGQFPAPQVSKEQVGRDERQQQAKRQVEGPGLREG